MIERYGVTPGSGDRQIAGSGGRVERDLFDGVIVDISPQFAWHCWRLATCRRDGGLTDLKVFDTYTGGQIDDVIGTGLNRTTVATFTHRAVIAGVLHLIPAV